MPTSGKTTRTIVWAVVLLFTVAVGSTVVLAVFADADTAATVITSVLANLAGLVAVLANLQRTATVESKVDTVVKDTSDLRNGLLDAKVRAGVAEVVHPDLRAPGYDPAADQARRELGQDPSPDLPEGYHDGQGHP